MRWKDLLGVWFSVNSCGWIKLMSEAIQRTLNGCHRTNFECRYFLLIKKKAIAGLTEQTLTLWFLKLRWFYFKCLNTFSCQGNFKFATRLLRIQTRIQQWKCLGNLFKFFQLILVTLVVHKRHTSPLRKWKRLHKEQWTQNGIFIWFLNSVLANRCEFKFKSWYVLVRSA